MVMLSDFIKTISFLILIVDRLIERRWMLFLKLGYIKKGIGRPYITYKT